MVEREGEKYPLARKWNEFVGGVQKAREKWEELQGEIELVGKGELENYPAVAQKHLGRFRGVKFEWMLPMFADYYRGSGGLDEMFIILPPTKDKKGEEK